MGLKKENRGAWWWIPSLYYAEGIPYVIVMLLSVIMYKRMGISNAEIALYTSILYLPWALKPFWSPFIDIFRTKRWWIVIMQLFIGACLAGVAFSIPTENYLKYTLAFLFILAFSSATHDIAADGFYMLGLSQGDQALFVGIRSTFYRIAMITGQGLLVILAGYLESHSGLKSPEFHITASPTAEVRLIDFKEDGVSFTDNNELRLVTDRDRIELSTNNITKAESDSIIFLVKKHNSLNGHYGIEAKNSFKGEYVSNEKNRDLLVGNIAIVRFGLSNIPNNEKKQIIVNFDRESGDKSISLVEGTRFVFDDKNWNKPAYAVIQLDTKLKYVTETSFKPIAGDIPWAWATTFWIVTGLFIVFFIYHFLVLPYPVSDKAVLKEKNDNIFKEFGKTFVTFFKKKQILLGIAFLLIYRFGEAQLVKLASPFLIDSVDKGGLGLTTGQFGIVYGTVGVIALTIGGIVGGLFIAKRGLKRSIWWMFMSINIPHLLYVYLAYAQPTNFFIINFCVAGEQFGYGFGFTAYMLYMIYISEGEFKTSHYALCTSFMALSMMLPGMVSGYIEEFLGYKLFFVWVLLTMVPGFFIIKYLKIDPEFGIKKKQA